MFIKDTRIRKTVIAIAVCSSSILGPFTNIGQVFAAEETIGSMEYAAVENHQENVLLDDEQPPAGTSAEDLGEKTHKRSKRFVPLVAAAILAGITITVNGCDQSTHHHHHK